MIFYGTNSSRLKDGQLNNVTCPNCENQTLMTYSVFGKYAYLYWIPVFPMGKVNVLECNSCKKTFKLSELPNQIKSKFELEKHRGVPLLHFSGLGIIGILILGAIYLSNKDSENDILYIQEPLVGDVYSIETIKKGYYTSGKVVKVTTDSLHIIFNDYEIDRKSKIYKIDKSENYTSEPESYAKAQIQGLFDDGEIYEVDRD